MKKEEIKKAVKRSKCGECYYNGVCKRPLSICKYLKPVVILNEESDK